MYGVLKKMVLFNYVFWNVLILIIIIFGLLILSLVGGVFIMEIVFLWLGFGLLGVNVIFRFDYLIIMVIILLLLFMLIFGNLIVDILYGVVDLCIWMRGWFGMNNRRF